MAQWFLSKVSYYLKSDDGLHTTQTDQLLIDAVSFTEAEKRINEELSGVLNLVVKSVTKSHIKEVVFYGDSDFWHKCKVSYSIYDDETEKEKKVTTHILINTNSVSDAIERLGEYLKDMSVPWKCTKVEETQIVQVFEFKSRLNPDGDSGLQTPA